MKVVAFALGCKVNKYEADSILEDFKQKGYEVSDKLEYADIYILNTCAVTSEAEKKSRQLVSRCKKFNPNAKIYVCGCASQKDISQFENKGVTFVKGNAGKQKMIDEIEKTGLFLEELPKNYEKMTFSHQNRTRAYIKIQDGCNNFCSYCIIPYLRGRSRSRELEDIIDEAKNLPSDVQEIVVVGINVSDYKIDDKKALINVLEELDKLGKRVRLSSLEDGIIDEEFMIRLAKLKNFCPHFHLSLQSGSDSVLKRMNRHYTSQQFKHSVEIIRKYFPFAGITTDVIVGYPKESEEEFCETLNFVKDVEFSMLHIFQYSHRTGTVASKLEDILPNVKKERAARLEEVNKELQSKFIKENKEQTLSVLIEEEKGGYFIGHSKNFIKCYIKGNKLKIGQIIDVKIEKEYLDGVIANAV